MSPTIEELRQALDEAYRETSEGSDDAKAAFLEKLAGPGDTSRGYRRPRRSRRTLTVAWTGGIAALVLTLALVVPQVINTRSPSATNRTNTRALPTGLPEILAVVGDKLELLSEKTGSVLREVTALGSSHFDVVSVTADDMTAYVGSDAPTKDNPVDNDQQVVPEKIERVPLGGGGTSIVAMAALSPAISPDGDRLAYVTHGYDIVVRDLASGATRTWTLPGADVSPHVLPAPVMHLAWLSDGLSLVVTIQLPESSWIHGVKDEGVEVLNTSLPLGKDNPRYLGPTAAQLGSAGWSLATQGPEGSIAVVTEQPFPVRGFREGTVADAEIDMVSPETGKATVWFQPHLKDQAGPPPSVFSIYQLAFGASETAYVTGGWQCDGCLNITFGPQLNSVSHGTLHYLDGFNPASDTVGGELNAVAWLQHTFKR